MKPRLLLVPVAWCVASLAAGGCAIPMSAGAHLDRAQDFSVYRTYAWGPADARPTGDARLDGDPFFQDRMQGAIEKQLAARGLSLATGSTDLVIHYHAVISERIDINRIDQAYGYCADGACAPEVTRYEQGTLVLDIIDRRTQKLVWRGWAQSDIERALRDRSRLGALIDAAAERMMQRFPRAVEPAPTPSFR